MNAEYDKLFGRNLRALRIERKLTQEQLAAKMQLAGCDMTRSALAKIEAGQRHIYADELYALQRALEIAYERLFPDPSV